MKRVLMLIVVAFAGAWAYEEFSGKNLGIKDTVREISSGGFAGGYGYATQAGGSAADALDASVPYTAAQAGAAIASLVTDPAFGGNGAYLLGPDGLQLLAE